MLLCQGCEENEISQNPEIRLTVIPGSAGLTTDIFEFDASQSINPKGAGKIYFEWNFDEGAGWEQRMSKQPKRTKRFMKPGSYDVGVISLNSKGCSDTAFFNVKIALGRSAPRPLLKVEPLVDHFLTRFWFDARMTRDDEDSSGTLRIRWDYDGDGFWDTPWDTTMVSSFVFNKEGEYEPKIEVTDPTGLKAKASARITVTNIDPDIVADFIWTPTDATYVDTILFDASASHHLTNPTPTFLYSWRFDEGWTIPSPEPRIRYRFRNMEGQTVRLRVIDVNRLMDTLSKPIHLDPQNFPPIANFDVSVPYGNIRTQFRLSAWNCSDDHDDVGDLLIRWDFDGDGFWDTGFSTEKLLFHQYSSAGHFPLTIEVKDSKGLISRYSRKILVSPWENETGILHDSRDLQFYGTVRIGNRWWMAENLKYDFKSDLVPSRMMYPHLALNFDQSTVETYGRFYYLKDVVVNRVVVLNREIDYVNPICPSGWKIPTIEDWQQLIIDTNAEKEPENLVLGGKSDFNATYMGYADFVVIYKGLTPVDTIFTFKDTFTKAWFFSANQNTNILRPDLFMVKIERNGPKLWIGWDNLEFYIPVRCVKED